MRLLTISVVSKSEEISRESIVEILRNEDLAVPVSNENVDKIVRTEYSVDVYFSDNVVVSTTDLYHLMDRYEQIVDIHIK